MKKSHRGRSWRFTAPAGVGLLAMISGLVSPINASAATPSDMTLAIEQSIPSVDGLVSNSAPVNQMIDAALTKVGLSGSVAPDLATSWTSNANATVWTFKLRPNLKFSNGAPLTAADVVFSYKTVEANPKSLNQSYITALQTITAPNPQTIVMTLNLPVAEWPRQTTLISIEPQATYNAATFATKPVGAGPYEVVSYNGTNTVTMTENPDYYGPKPAIKNATVEYIENSTTVLDGLESGQIDAGLLQGTDVNVAKSAGLVVKSIPSSKVIYLGYNVKAPGLDLLKLRQAISYAVNRQALVNTILLGQGKPQNQLVTSRTFGYDPAISVPTVNITKAKQLVKESGYNGAPIVLDYPTDYIPAPAELAQAVAGDLKLAGINVKLVGEDATSFLTSWASAKLPAMYLFSIQTVTLDAGGTFLYFDKLIDTSKDPELLKLYNAEEGQPKVSARLKLLGQDSVYLNTQAYYTPLFSDDFSYVYNKKYNLPTPPANGYGSPQYFTGS